MQLEFFGAAGEVTGSCHILRVSGKALLFDCGLIQGDRAAAARNQLPFPFDAAAIDAVILSHAHIDHCGRLPLLVKRGFRGPIYTNGACAELLPILLRDAAKLAMGDAARTNRQRSAGASGLARETDAPSPALPLFDVDDVDAVLDRVRPIPYDLERELLPGVVIRVRDAGHILGSSSIEARVTEAAVTRLIVFSGDLGQYDTPILHDPWTFQSADLVLMESTYGDRRHRDRDGTERELGAILDQAARDGGNVVVPAFAIGRSQELLYLLAKHYAAWHVAKWKIFLDSPMAIAASRVYWRHPDRFDEEAMRLRESFRGLPPLPNLVLSQSADESRAINDIRGGALIIAGSGMANGGRVLHHLRHNLPRAECHVLIVGFQAPGTLGRQLVDRAPHVRIHGYDVRCAAQVHTLGGLSAHGDQDDLLRWYANFRPSPPVYLVHGEPPASEALAAKLRDRGANATVARPGLKVDLADLNSLARERSIP